MYSQYLSSLGKEYISLKLAHWQIVPQKTIDSFHIWPKDKIKWESRLMRLIHQIQNIDADVLGISGIDAKIGSHWLEHDQFMTAMQDIGYECQYFEK